MNRDYESGVLSTPVLFVGKEVERTRHYDEQTLFVVGLNFTISELIQHCKEHKCTHVYLAANHSYPGVWAERTWIEHCLILRKHGLNVTLESEYTHVTANLVSASKLFDFVLMVGCPVPNIHENIVVKVDDVDFKATNSGVWTVMPLCSTDVHFTPWDAYKNDKVIK